MTYKQEEIKPYDPDSDKGEQVARMFNNIAHSYDKLNHRLSWNIDKIWRKAAINSLRRYNPRTILDIATGTGDFAIEAARMLAPDQIIGADISIGMLKIGNEKVKKLGLDSVIAFKKEDCMTAPVHHPIKELFKIYSHTILPLYGKLISHDNVAYSYLTATIEAFPQGEKMVSILKNAGFSDACFKRHTFGICTTYFATK